MASQPGRDTDAVCHGDETAQLLSLLGELRDELHRLAAEVAEGVTTPEQYHELAGRLRRVSVLLSLRGERLAVQRYGVASEL
ncbi:MAG: hypothetical protein LC799_15235 [Actinobacteria bacterium]|nr:hypothetical protein [Actinomycetota bacterium]